MMQTSWKATQNKRAKPFNFICYLRKSLASASSLVSYSNTLNKAWSVQRIDLERLSKYQLALFWFINLLTVLVMNDCSISPEHEKLNCQSRCQRRWKIIEQSQYIIFPRINRSKILQLLLRLTKFLLKGQVRRAFQRWGIWPSKAHPLLLLAIQSHTLIPPPFFKPVPEVPEGFLLLQRRQPFSLFWKKETVGLHPFVYHVQAVVFDRCSKVASITKEHRNFVTWCRHSLIIQLSSKMARSLEFCSPLSFSRR